MTRDFCPVFIAADELRVAFSGSIDQNVHDEKDHGRVNKDHDQISSDHIPPQASHVLIALCAIQLSQEIPYCNQRFTVCCRPTRFDQ